ncbi:MAG: hypothetical protein NTV58_12355 [Deltaproteobacteria bacterium]|nr:hypothetical protein [Deltaproteobacteria bacterium]
MKIYHWHPDTYEYLGTSEARIDPLETAKTRETVYMIPAHATPDQPPQTGANQAARRINNDAWEVVDDYRGQEYWDKDTGEKITITALGVIIPIGNPTQAPPLGMFDPKWYETAWVETAIVFQGTKVTTKADVDQITSQLIIALGEAKAKTEKLMAGSDPCPIWDTFIAARAVILQEGDEYIIANSLT